MGLKLDDGSGEEVCCVDVCVWSESASVGSPLSDPRGSVL